MRIVICGGGVIGAAIAYFLSLRQVEVVVVEGTGVACAASGKSGGFLALDWCDGSPLEALARRSFQLHADLAARFPEHWSYRRLDTWNIAASARRSPAGSRDPGAPAWLRDDALLHQRLGTTESTAQIDPGAFTRGLMDAAIENGARLQVGRVTGLTGLPERVAGVLVDGQPLEAEGVVIAMGPWSILAAGWLPLPAVYGLMGHSVIFRNPTPVSPDALFVQCELDDGTVETPEVFPRPDGTTYVCGLSDEAPLPVDPAAIDSSPDASARLRAMTRTFAPGIAEGEIVASQACYRPVTRDGLPLMGRVAGIEGAYVATGHSVWGMLNAPASGEAMAELIVDGTTRTVDLAAFDPARLPAFTPQSGSGAG